MTVQQACDDFLTHCRVAKNLSPHTLRAYATDLQEFVAFTGADRGVATVDRPHLRAYLRHLFEVRRLKETSIKRRLACLKVMFRWLELDEVIAISPFHRLDARIKMPRRLPRCLSTEEARQLLVAPASRLGMPENPRPASIRRAAKAARINDLTALVAVEVLLCTGLRVGELAGVQVGDLDLTEGVITVLGKGSRQRRVFLPDATVLTLVTAYLEARGRLTPDHTAFLVNSRGRPATPQFLRKLVRQAGEEAALARRTTPHMLRHTAATQLLEAGVDIRFVQRLLGHQSISTTEGYTNVSDGSLKAVLLEARAKIQPKRRR